MVGYILLGVAFTFIFCFVALLCYGLVGGRSVVAGLIQNYLKRDAQRTLMLTTILMSLIVGIQFSLCTAIDFVDFACAAFVATFPFVGAMLFALVAFKRKYPIPGKIFMSVSLFLALSMIQGGAALCLGLNQYRDESLAQRHVLPVIYKQSSNDPNEHLFHLVVPSWRHAENITIIPVNRSVFEMADPGVHYLEVITKSGRMGYEWIVSKKLTE